MRSFALAILAGFVICGTPAAQAQGADSASQIVSLCDVLNDPMAFDGKKIQFRGRVWSEFENFTVSGESCPSQYGDGVWLMFGGDVDCPTSSTVNDVGRPKGADVKFRGVKYPLVKDDSFRLFHKVVTTRKKMKTGYRVTATLEGTFFSGTVGKDKNNRPVLPGYGHLGCCHLFIIHQVSQVEAKEL